MTLDMVIDVSKSVCLSMCVHAKSLQSCPTFFNPMDYSPLGSPVHGILQARVLEWVAFPPPENLSNQGTEPMSLIYIYPALAGRFFTTSAAWEVPSLSIKWD